MLNNEDIIVTPAALGTLMDCLLRQPAVAVDTEADSLYSYFDKVCLLQFSTREADYLVDPLALKELSALAPFLPTMRSKRCFTREYDILCLKRDYHCFNNIFDTMVARILGWKNVGLGNILQERFGVMLNKKLQRADWGHRSLTAEELTYGREDTHYLLALRDLQLAELQRLERLDEAREEFERLTRVEPTPRHFDPEGYWNVKGARELEPQALGILRELYRLRDNQAQRKSPAIQNSLEATLVALSASAPSSQRELSRRVSEYALKRYGTVLLDAIARGRAHPQNSTPRPNSRHAAPLDKPARARLDRLKEWRKKRAAARGVENDVIVPNDALITLARKNPQTVEEVARVTGLGGWKVREYGGELLSVLGKK
jgi:ribonuclease D